MAVSKEPEHVCKKIAMVPLEKETFPLNRELKEKENAYSQADKPNKPFVNNEVYFERCLQLERENTEMKTKLKKMENYCRGCKTELQRFVKRFMEFKNINKDLDVKNKQLLIKNHQMRQRIAEILKENRPQFEDLEKVTEGCDRQYQEKQQPMGSKQQQDKHLGEPGWEPHKQLDSPQNSKEIQEVGNQETKILTHLQQENKTLKETLEHSSHVLKDAELKAERSQRQQHELENCLFAVQAEKNLLRQEVKRLHKEYMSLTNSVSLQLKGSNKAASLSTEVKEDKTRGFQRRPQRDMHYNPPQQRSTVAHCGRRHNKADEDAI